MYAAHFCANIDQVFFFCTYSIFLYFIRRKRTPEIFVRDDFQYNKTFSDFLKEFRFYRESRENGTIPEDIYQAWVKKTLIAADELSVNSKQHSR